MTETEEFEEVARTVKRYFYVIEDEGFIKSALGQGLVTVIRKHPVVKKAGFDNGYKIRLLAYLKSFFADEIIIRIRKVVNL